MNEHAFRKNLQADAKLFPKIVELHSIPSGIMKAGLCDCFWQCYAGNYWIEYKCIEIPKRADTPVDVRKLHSDLQYRNLAKGFNMNGMSATILGFEWSGKKYAKVFAPPELDAPWYYFPDLYKCICKPRGGAWDFAKFNAQLQNVTKLRWGVK